MVNYIFLLDRRDGETPTAPAPKTSSPPVGASPSQATTAVGPSTSPPTNKEADAFDEFDPRGPVSGIENPRGFLFATSCRLTPNNLFELVNTNFVIVV